MPTGYTAGILDGKTTTFPQFAKLCMRAFGATIHMRDDDMGIDYKQRTPSDYHIDKIKEARKVLKDVDNLTDDEIIANHKAELEKNKTYHLGAIKKAEEGEQRLNAILAEIQKWEPPSSDHVELKNFMIDQIEKTIDFDCKPKYHVDYLEQITKDLSNLQASEIRKNIIEKANKDLKYHTDEHNLDVERCNKSNKWVSDLLNSL